jgi:hypothetical protein
MSKVRIGFIVQSDFRRRVFKPVEKYLRDSSRFSVRNIQHAIFEAHDDEQKWGKLVSKLGRRVSEEHFDAHSLDGPTPMDRWGCSPDSLSGFWRTLRFYSFWDKISSYGAYEKRFDRPYAAI